LHDSFRPPEPFRCEVHPAGGRTRLHLYGELDLGTVEQARGRLEELLAAGHRQVVLDLRELTFMDSTGLRLVIEWDAAARADGFDFTVIPGDGPVLRLFRLSGVDGHLTLADG
jgi:anti-sigma B factor antagonist